MQLVVAAEEVDRASGALWEHAPLAVGEEPAADGRVVLLAGFADAATAAQVADALADRWSPSVVAAPDEASWRDAWRAHAEVVTIGRLRLWPSWWEDPAPAADGVTVLLDPGWAFGSGTHPSTRMALRAVDRLVPPGARVLDMGCGSGVLGIAAALLGALSVVAVDVDPEARRATAANAEANGVGDRLVVTEDLAGGPFDLVLANIGAAVLTDMAPALAARTGDRGWLVLGGFLTAQAPALASAYGRVPPGWDVVDREDEDGWTGLVLAPAVMPPRPAGPRRR